MKWPEHKLIKLVDRFISGGTPSTKIEGYWDGDIPWITGADFNDGEVILGRRFISQSGLENSATNVVPKGSILMVTRTGVGKIAIAPEDVAISQDITGIVLKQSLFAVFVIAAIRSRMSFILAAQRGATIKGITREDIENLLIPWPAPSEQRRIVEILYQADALRKKRAKADAKAARILPALFYKMFGDPATNPKGWPVGRIRDLVIPIQRRDPAEQPDNMFVYIDIAGVDGQMGTIVETKELLGTEAPSRARQIVHENDVIVSTVRPYLRATALVPKHLNNQICSTGFCVLRAKNGRGFGFLYALSRLQWFTEQLNARARGASYPAVTDRDILEMEVPRPEFPAMQKLFDIQVSDLFYLKQKRKAALKGIEKLFATLLHRAFNGDLTAEWREAHMKELLSEIEMQVRRLDLSKN